MALHVIQQYFVHVCLHYNDRFIEQKCAAWCWLY